MRTIAPAFLFSRSVSFRPSLGSVWCFGKAVQETWDQVIVGYSISSKEVQYQKHAKLFCLMSVSFLTLWFASKSFGDAGAEFC